VRNTRLGGARALVVHGEDGLDEVSLAAPTLICEVDGVAGTLREYSVTPESLGCATAPREAVLGGDAQTNAAMLRGLLSGEVSGAPADMVALNAGAALYVTGRADSLSDGVRQSRAGLREGRGITTLEALGVA
jgi:anthranilate phosphoribosyltransferase